jgi:aryl-alcohol dehydrogenase-like predicted oxidoreductase
MMSGGVGNPEYDDCIYIIHKALDAGINFIDMGDAYSWGEPEEIVGKVIKWSNYTTCWRGGNSL